MAELASRTRLTRLKRTAEILDTTFLRKWGLTRRTQDLDATSARNDGGAAGLIEAKFHAIFTFL
jgi:hypothetical protein